MTTHAINGHEVEITGAPRFNRRRPARYIFRIADDADYTQERTFASESDALDAARHHLGVDSTITTCVACARPATMNASGGPTCDEHFDNYADHAPAAKAKVGTPAAATA